MIEETNKQSVLGQERNYCYSHTSMKIPVQVAGVDGVVCFLCVQTPTWTGHISRLILPELWYSTRCSQTTQCHLVPTFIVIQILGLVKTNWYVSIRLNSVLRIEFQGILLKSLDLKSGWATRSRTDQENKTTLKGSFSNGISCFTHYLFGSAVCH